MVLQKAQLLADKLARFGPAKEIEMQVSQAALSHAIHQFSSSEEMVPELDVQPQRMPSCIVAHSDSCYKGYCLSRHRAFI